MVNYDDWLVGKRSPMSESLYAVKQWELILVKPVSITIKRGGTNLAAQTVRIEYSNYDRPEVGKSDAVSIKRDVIVFGVKGHPDETIANTDIKKADLFTFEGQSMKVLDVVKVKGGVQAHCEAYS